MAALRQRTQNVSRIVDTPPRAKSWSFGSVGILLGIRQLPCFVVGNLILEIHNRTADLRWGFFDLMYALFQPVEQRYWRRSVKNFTGKSPPLATQVDENIGVVAIRPYRAVETKVGAHFQT